MADTDVLAYSRRIAHLEIPVQELLDDTSVSEYDRRQILALALYTIEYEADQRDRRSRRQRRAMRLLQSFLTEPQRAQLKRSGGYGVVVRGSLGNYYRLNPRMGNVWRVERRRSRWYYVATYCLHDYAEDDPAFVPTLAPLPNLGNRSQLPAADRSLAHLLLLAADEGEFRLLANESIRYGVRYEWHFRLREERRQIERDRQIQEAA